MVVVGEDEVEEEVEGVLRQATLALYPVEEEVEVEEAHQWTKCRNWLPISYSSIFRKLIHSLNTVCQRV